MASQDKHSIRECLGKSKTQLMEALKKAQDTNQPKAVINKLNRLCSQVEHLQHLLGS